MAKILIVDDSPTETYKLTNILEKNDHSVLSAASGEQGVDLAKTEQPDVVLIDRLAIGIALLYKHNCGAIIFTGMGDDGEKGCQTTIDRGGIVWVQDPDSCTAPAMAAAVLRSNKVDFVGTPSQLAGRIRTEVEQMEACSQ